LRAAVETLNPYQSPSLPATPAAPASALAEHRRSQCRLQWLVGLQVVGVLALLLVSHEIGRAMRIPGWLPSPAGIALGLPATLAVGMMLVGPCLWLRCVLGKTPAGAERLWWFVILEPVLLTVTLLALTP
jgi:hypothetical protein